MLLQACHVLLKTEYGILSEYNIPKTVKLWILEFQTNREQRVIILSQVATSRGVRFQLASHKVHSSVRGSRHSAPPPPPWMVDCAIFSNFSSSYFHQMQEFICNLAKNYESHNFCKLFFTNKHCRRTRLRYQI